MQRDDSIEDAPPDAPRVLGRGALRVEGLGTMVLAWSARGVTALDFVDDAEAPDAVDPLPPRVRTVLEAYVAGAPVDPARDLEVDLTGTPFQLAVWHALRAIPRGTVRTYASIAQDVRSPRGMRAVGLASGANPVAIIVPCHRVVAHGLELGGFRAGLARKVWLLEREGARVSGGRVAPGQLGLL
jgi:methylated-DNA-[protein]-cysteine S-methyltransferase